MKRTHVLFDLDGTLSDSEPGIMNSLVWACEQEGFPRPSDTEVRSAIGPPLEEALPAIGIPDDALQRVINTYRSRYVEIGAFENTLYDGILELLRDLSDLGLTLTVATAKPEQTAFPILDYFGITDRFEVAVGTTLTSERRTKAEVIDKVLRDAGLWGQPDLIDRCIMIGDRYYDVTGAMKHGITCIGVTWGYGSPEELFGAGAVALADSPAEVVELVQAEYRFRGQ